MAPLRGKRRGTAPQTRHAGHDVFWPLSTCGVLFWAVFVCVLVSITWISRPISPVDRKSLPLYAAGTRGARVIYSDLRPARLVALGDSPSWSRARPTTPAGYCPCPGDRETHPARLVALGDSPSWSRARPTTPAGYCPCQPCSVGPAMRPARLVALGDSPSWSRARPTTPAGYCPCPGDRETHPARLAALADSPNWSRARPTTPADWCLCPGTAPTTAYCSRRG